MKGVTVPHGLNHFWSLAIEEQFYLIWPALVLLVSSRRLRTICLWMLPLGLLFRIWLMTTPYAHTGGYVLTPARMGTLAVGAWLASAMREPGLRKRIERWAPHALAFSVISLVAMNLPDLRMNGFEPRMQTIGFPLLAVGAASIMVLAMSVRRRWTWYQKMFRSKVLSFFGKYSYGMYVLHLPVVVAFEGLRFSIGVFPRVGDSDVPGAIAFTLIALATTTLMAFLSWNLYEKQFLRLKSRFK
jgi:peptidoglycan/LPS O-acetylase OafA/YrhL